MVVEASGHCFRRPEILAVFRIPLYTDCDRGTAAAAERAGGRPQLLAARHLFAWGRLGYILSSGVVGGGRPRRLAVGRGTGGAVWRELFNFS